MVTHLFRHGQTAYSAQYRLNGDPEIVVPLSAEGVVQSVDGRPYVLKARPVACRVSGFVRTTQTAALLLGGMPCVPAVDTGLNELDYGAFEGRPYMHYAKWLDDNGPEARPPGSCESLVEGTRRMLTALTRLCTLPSPRLVVGHGLLYSVVRWRVKHSGPVPMHLSPAPYVKPLVITDLACPQPADVFFSGGPHEPAVGT